MDSRNIMRLISFFAWMIIGGVIILACMFGFNYSMNSVAENNVEAATEYAMKSAAEHLHYLEESMGPPWPAHGPADYESEFVKSTSYSVEGRTVRYEFEIYITSKVMGDYIETSYYKVVVTCQGSVFSLISVDKIEPEETEYDVFTDDSDYE